MAIQSNNSNLTKLQTYMPAANSDNMAGMRMAAPVANSFLQYKMAHDTIQVAKQAADSARTMAAVGEAAAGAASAGGLFSKLGNAFNFSGAIGGALKSFVGALKSNFAISAVLSGISNVYELASGKVKPLQAASNFVADTAAYTTIGATATTIGAFLGTLIPIPVFGTAIGIAIGGGIGLLLGKLYEDKLRPSFSGMVQQGVQSLMKGATTSTTTPPSIPSATPVAPTPPTPAPVN